MFAGERLGKIRIAFLYSFRELHVLGISGFGPVRHQHLRFAEEPQRRIDGFQRFFEISVVRPEVDLHVESLVVVGQIFGTALQSLLFLNLLRVALLLGGWNSTPPTPSTISGQMISA